MADAEAAPFLDISASDLLYATAGIASTIYSSSNQTQTQAPPTATTYIPPNSMPGSANTNPNPNVQGTKPNYLLYGGIGVAVLVLILVLRK